MKIDFKSMDGRKKKLYSALWGDFDFSTINAEVEKTMQRQSRAGTKKMQNHRTTRIVSPEKWIKTGNC